MHFLKFICTALALSCAIHVSAQNNINLVKIGASTLSVLAEGQDQEAQHFVGGGMAFEHQLGKKTSLAFGANFNTNEGARLEYNGVLIVERITVLSFEPEFRWYPTSATKGFYLGFAPGIYWIAGVYSGPSAVPESDTRFIASLKTGYQLSLSNRLKLQFGAGLGALFPTADADPSAILHLNAMLGYKF
jgi:hypothetical protein